MYDILSTHSVVNLIIVGFNDPRHTLAYTLFRKKIFLNNRLAGIIAN